MKAVKRWWVVVFLGTLLVAALVGVALARPDAVGDAAGTTMVVTVPSAACIPATDTTDWYHSPNYLECSSGYCYFVCPFDFPIEGGQQAVSARVKRITAYVYDNLGAEAVVVYLNKTDPGTGTAWVMAQVNSTNSTAIQALSTTTITKNPVLQKHATLLYVYFSSPGLKVYGFRIFYTR